MGKVGLVVASIGLTEGGEGRSSEPRTKAWSRVGDGENNKSCVFGVVLPASGFRVVV